MRDPYKIDGPTCISFSGGRTSAYMLRQVLDSNGGLPADAHVIFANTGKEDPATLDFVRDCGERWSVPIIWVEYRADEPGYAIVDFETASRNGEPFEALIKKRNYLPNAVARFCTVELKILRAVDVMRAMGYEEHDNMIGFRADEPSRVAKVRKDPSGGTKGVERLTPLAKAGVTKRDIQRYWQASDFDLQLENVNGTTPEGNCDLCFLKSSARILSLIAQKPTRAIWWGRMEGSINNPNIQGGGYFHKDRPSYSQMAAFTGAQADAFGHAAALIDDGIECLGCTD
jgi:3'-phosphoadenosine 5'-phosphosulfate sulfotransferase (PAPS reductase)/FAD synthetase